MKIRIIAILYTIVILICGIVLWNKIGESSSYSIDMLDLNTKRDEIEDKLLSGADIPSLENEYNCKIALVADDGYESMNNYFIKEGMSVFDYREDGAIAGKIAFNAREEEFAARTRNSQIQMLWVLGSVYAAGVLLMFIIWYFYIRPFNKLSSFAASVSKGNLDVPLNMDRHNYFGAFTESFDRMREELKASSEREAAANRSKQELVAEISHDIKTPVATIKATCEVMEVKYKDEDIQEKVSVIKSKATSVEQLIDNMFRATLDDLDELKVTPREESSLIIEDMLGDLRFYGTVEQKGSVPECLILVDRLRLEQVIDNIAGNSFKYAGTALEVEYRSEEDNIRVILSDRGPGVPEDELAMLTTKFYRGSEASDSGKDGSGLGLYLASRFMEKMGGGLELRNREGGGFTAEIVIRKV
ncbi:HAMP domain-containing sensor histidine kinase [Butyrivibrio sp. AE2032]|uniref:HAMP domain-containing sensor histidine kinase n=1 Tax=Butyrivibrio sp. AE2032 TaxID=1458463 RepID=UPI000689DEEF|nr:HAMP domain-containing sensor histidine kinase [Butyrivibrio sp. AE2032]